MVAPTRLNITLYVYCLSCSALFPYVSFVICICMLWCFCYGPLGCSLSALIKKNSIELLLPSSSIILRSYSGEHWKHSTYRKHEYMKTLMLTCLNIETHSMTCSLPYILESNPRTNLIRTSFCRFLKRKKKS